MRRGSSPSESSPVQLHTCKSETPAGVSGRGPNRGPTFSALFSNISSLLLPFSAYNIPIGRARETFPALPNHPATFAYNKFIPAGNAPPRQGTIGTQPAGCLYSAKLCWRWNQSSLIRRRCIWASLTVGGSRFARFSAPETIENQVWQSCCKESARKGCTDR